MPSFPPPPAMEILVLAALLTPAGIIGAQRTGYTTEVFRAVCRHHEPRGRIGHINHAVLCWAHLNDPGILKILVEEFKDDADALATVIITGNKHPQVHGVLARLIRHPDAQLAATHLSRRLSPGLLCRWQIFSDPFRRDLIR